MPEERKPAPLPPEPWQVVLNPVEIDIDVLVIVDPNHSVVAYVPLESAPWYPEDVPDPKRMLARFIAAAPTTAHRCAALESEVVRLREALEWADAMIWPRIKMLERHNGDNPSEETSELRRILGPIRRAHKNGAVVSIRQELDAKAAQLRELADAISEYRWNPSSNPQVLQKSADRLDEVLRRVEAGAGEDKPCPE